MDSMNFVSRRKWVTSFLSFFVSSVFCLPLIFISGLGYYRLIPFFILFFYFFNKIKPTVSRLLVQDQRFNPAFNPGAYVKIYRLPYDFELEELMEDKIGYFEFPWDYVGNVVKTDGVFVWIETHDAYIPCHVNCLQLVPGNYFRADFESGNKKFEFEKSGDKD